MKNLLGRVLDLQQSYSSRNTQEMRERGRIVCELLPGAIRSDLSALAAAMGLAENSVGVAGRDGTGGKSLVPWVRIFGTERSPNSRTGWYVVYLFSGKGARVYLSLMQSTMDEWDPVRKQFSLRPRHVLKARSDWALPVIRTAAAGRDGLVWDLRLEVTANSKAGKAYPPGNLVAFEYDRDAMPSADVLRDDLRFMVGLLGRLYAAEEATADPAAPVPEVVEAEEGAALAAGRRIAKHSSGQGFRLSSVEREVIEQHSVRLATEYFEGDGWSVTDVGATESFDLLLEREGEVRRVEVKGTTSLGRQVVLTRSEVEEQRKYYPDNALIVVHSIKLDRSEHVPVASGGQLECTSPWTIGDEDLTPISYVYRTAAR